jgi:hypothetical protein
MTLGTFLKPNGTSGQQSLIAEANFPAINPGNFPSRIDLRIVLRSFFPIENRPGELRLFDAAPCCASL